LSAFHIIEQINAPSFPIAVPRVAILAYLSREEADPAEVQLHLRIFSGAQLLFDGPFPANFSHQLTVRSIVELNGLIVPGPAEMRFVLLNGEDVLDFWNVAVIQTGHPALQLNLPPPPPAAPAQ
jgi:hypothetical protein